MIVGIVGGGAIGTLLGAVLAPHVDVRLLVRDHRAARAIASRGGLILDDGPPRRVEVSADPGVFHDASIVIVAVKTYATIASLSPLRGSACRPFVAFQNGDESVAQIEYALGRHGGIALAPTTEGVTRVEPGIARRNGRGTTRIGWARGHAGTDAPLHALVAAFAHDLSIERVDPVEPYVWAKLVANAAINPLTALAGIRNGDLFARPELRQRAARIAREAANVATADGIVLPFDDPVAYVENVASITAANRSSMLEDLAAGRPTEIEAINGRVVRLAAALGLPVPENARVLDEVRARQRA